MKNEDSILYILLWSLIALLAITGVAVDGPKEAFDGFLQIQVSSGRLLNDFIEIGGIGGAFINAALVATIALTLILVSKVKLSGPTFAAVLTLLGFALFGKTPVNISPIILGVFLAGKFVGKEFREYIIIALFGTALGPVVSYAASELGLTGGAAIASGLGIGVVTGFFLPALAVAMLHLHQGYNLYNMGLTCGFFSLFVSALFMAGGQTFEPMKYWSTEQDPVLLLLIPVISVVFILLGLIIGKGASFKSLKQVQSFSGRLPSDFMVMGSLHGSLINIGLIGLTGSLYVYLVEADFNGPVLGGLFTIMGFGAFGTNLRNTWPVVLGVVISALIFNKELNHPAVILAAIFVTTLGPIAGQFGFIAGIIAGFMHLALVLQTGAWSGGINLYNNGFAGGFTAAVLIAIIQWYKTNKTVPSFRGKKVKKL